MKKTFFFMFVYLCGLSLSQRTFATTPCAGVVSQYPLTQGFENSSNLWTQLNGTSLNWDLNVGGTLTPNTGPNSASEGLAYMYVEATNQLGSGVLESPCMDLTVLQNPELRFDHTMYGSDVFRLVIQASTDGGNTWGGLLFNKSGDQGPNWISETIDLSPYQSSNNFRFRVIGVVSSITTGDEGDIAIDNFVVDEALPCFEISINYTNVSCSGLSDAQASLLLFPANTPGLITTWSTGSNANSISNLSPGNYAVTVTDNATCTKIKSFTISEPQVLSVDLFITPTSSSTSADGRILAQVSGGTPPYQFLWYNGTTGALNLNLSNGYEAVKVTDSNGCIIKMPTFVPVEEICTRRYNNWPYHLSFDGGFGRFKQGIDDDRNWGRRTTVTPTPNTGPSAPAQGSRYRYLESSGSGSPLKTGVIVSKRCFNITALSNPELYFQYHMYGIEMGQLYVQVSTDGGYVWQETIWEEEGNQGDIWKEAFIDLNDYSSANLLIRIVGRTGSGQLSDIALDDLHIRSASTTSRITTDTNQLPSNNVKVKLRSLSDLDLHVYPNPIQDQLVLEQQGELIHFELLTVDGRLLMKNSTNEKRSSLDLSSYQSGLYFLRIANKTNEWTTHKILKL